MSLRISNLATAKQRAMLCHVGYLGIGKYALDKLSREDAAELLNELFEEQRLEQRDNVQYTKENSWD